MRTAVLLFFLLVPAFAIGQSVAERARQGELAFMRDEEPAMLRAFQVARETLDAFLEIAKRGDPNHTGFALKIAITQRGNTEYFWINKFESKGSTQFEGEINNEPRMVTSVRLGQRYVFSRDRIVDWTYIERSERRMVGNFTMCALLTKEPPKEAETTIRRFKLDCSRVVQ